MLERRAEVTVWLVKIARPNEAVIARWGTFRCTRLSQALQCAISNRGDLPDKENPTANSCESTGVSQHVGMRSSLNRL